MTLRYATTLAQRIHRRSKRLVKTSILKIKGTGDNYAIEAFHIGLKRKILIHSYSEWESIQEAWKSAMSR